MNYQKCFGASIRTTSQKCAAPRIDGEGFSRSFLRQEVTKRERETVRRTAERQAAGDDSHIDYSDIPALTNEQPVAMTRFRDVRDRLEKKKMISLYVRGDVLEWRKSKGPGHLTRINDILTSVMEAERRVKKSA